MNDGDQATFVAVQPNGFGLGGMQAYNTARGVTGDGESVFALAERGDLPRILCWIHPKTGAPVPAIILTWVITAFVAAAGIALGVTISRAHDHAEPEDEPPPVPGAIETNPDAG